MRFHDGTKHGAESGARSDYLLLCQNWEQRANATGISGKIISRVIFGTYQGTLNTDGEHHRGKGGKSTKKTMAYMQKRMEKGRGPISE